MRLPRRAAVDVWRKHEVSRRSFRRRAPSVPPLALASASLLVFLLGRCARSWSPASSVAVVAAPGRAEVRCCPRHRLRRRGALAAATVVACGSETLFGRRGAVLAEVPAPPKQGGCVGCLGVVDDLLARCTGDLKGCVSSQDDRPQVFEAPWQLPVEEPTGRPGSNGDAGSDYASAMRRLQAAVAREGGKVLAVGEGGRYLRAEFPFDFPLLGKDVDDMEWYFTPNDYTVQFRGERRSGRPDFGENRRRLERMRESLGWEILPVLRNRRRLLPFGETPFDDFGPALYDALRPGQEPTRYEEEVLTKQSDRKKGLKKGGDFTFGEDDLGIENADGTLDAATRAFLRTRCDDKTQICE